MGGAEVPWSERGATTEPGGGEELTRQRKHGVKNITEMYTDCERLCFVKVNVTAELCHKLQQCDTL